MKIDIEKRRLIKADRSNVISDLNKAITNQNDEKKQIGVAIELSEKKTLVADVSLQKRQDLFITLKALKQKIKRISNEGFNQND